MKIGVIRLRRKHHHILCSPEEWLDDDIIAAAQHLLKKQYPHVEGLQPPAELLQSTMQPPSGEFVQILHAGGNHWIVISTVKCAQGSVNVFDSLNLRTPSSAVIEGLLSSKSRKINHVHVQQQQDGNDCGLFAIAFATSLCTSQDPSRVRYHQASLRNHLRECFIDENMTSFPVC